MEDDGDCQVTHQDHKEGLEYMRKTQFYKTLSKIIDETEE